MLFAQSQAQILQGRGQQALMNAPPEECEVSDADESTPIIAKKYQPGYKVKYEHPLGGSVEKMQKIDARAPNNNTKATRDPKLPTNDQTTEEGENTVAESLDFGEGLNVEAWNLAVQGYYAEDDNNLGGEGIGNYG